MLINVPISIGELFDKISILDIKTKKIKNKDDLKLIKYELSKLKKITKLKGLTSTKIKKKYILLKSINEKLWNIENKKREYERQKKFDKSFIELARKVYIFNDKRAQIKKDINLLSGSSIVEIKSHK
tara:strand:+ start:1351 stop:1731 length:381 start_codon:yes stop_codon:yes gene_type:complete